MQGTENTGEWVAGAEPGTWDGWEQRASCECRGCSRKCVLAQTGMQEAAAVKESCVRNNGLASSVDGRCSGSKS